MRVYDDQAIRPSPFPGFGKRVTLFPSGGFHARTFTTNMIYNINEMTMSRSMNGLAPIREPTEVDAWGLPVLDQYENDDLAVADEFLSFQ